MSIFIIKIYQEGYLEKVIEASGNKLNIFNRWDSLSNQFKFTNDPDGVLEISPIHFRYRLGFTEELVYSLEEIRLS